MEREVRWESEDQGQGWTMVPNSVVKNPDLSAQAKALYVALASFAWDKPEAWPGQERLADMMGVGERVIRKWMGELKHAGLVTVKQRGLGKTNIYTLTARVPDRNAASGLTGTPVPVLTGTPVPTKKTKVEEDEVELVIFDHVAGDEMDDRKAAVPLAKALISQWEHALGKPVTGKLGQRRLTAVVEALARGERKEDLLDAVWGITESDWHSERNITEFMVAIAEGNVQRFAELGRERKFQETYERERKEHSEAGRLEAQLFAIREDGYVIHPDGYLVHPISMTPLERERYENATPKEDS